MTTPADPNLHDGARDPNAADTTQGTADQTEHRGSPTENVSEELYQQAPGTIREDMPADSVAGDPEGSEGEHGHSGTFVPTSQTEQQSTGPAETDPELGGGKGLGSGADNDDPANLQPATTQDPDNPAISHGSNTPKPRY